MSSTSRKQGGYAALALVLVLIVVLAALIASYSARRGYAGVTHTARAQRHFLARARTRVMRYYEAHAADLDANGNTPWTGPQLLVRAGVPPRWQVAAFIGARQSTTLDGGAITLDYRDIWLALPGSATGSRAVSAALNTSTNVFQPGTSPAWTEIHGEDVEDALFVRAQSQLARLSDRLTAMYEADIDEDPGRNAAVDYWQPAGCGPYGGGAIACTNGQFLPAADLNLPEALGAQRIATENPWGLTLTANNTAPDANDTAPPYTMLWQSPLPWGGALTAIVTAPLI